MRTPVALVTAALTAAILLAASLLIATGTRGEDAIAPPHHEGSADRIVQGSPTVK
jgi:hypothetical protein